MMLCDNSKKKMGLVELLQKDTVIPCKLENEIFFCIQDLLNSSGIDSTCASLLYCHISPEELHTWLHMSHA